MSSDTTDERYDDQIEELLEDRQTDPVTLQVIAGELDTIAKEMAYNMIRSSYSSIIRESEDMGAGIFTPDCRELCESDTTPMHVGSLIGYLEGMYQTFEERGVDREEVVNEGDVFIHNHPYYGASHSPDIGVMVPVFYEGEHVAWSANTAHHLDVGAATPGLAVDLEDMYAEANLFRGTKLYDGGERVDEVWNYIHDNVRTPRPVIGDLQAQVAAAETGRDRYLELIDEFGVETVRTAGEELMDYAEALLREEIREVPDGTYYEESYLDDDGRNRGERLKVAVEITVDGTDMTVDLSDSADQTPTGFNVPFRGSADVCIYFTIRAILMDTYTHDEFLPQNSGTFEPVTPKARKGCIFNPNPPAACFARIFQTLRVCDLIVKALSEHVPDKVCAGTSGGGFFNSYSGVDSEGNHWVYLEVDESSYGGRPERDGMDAVDALIGNTKNRPVEDIELSHPLKIHQYELREDGHGAGRFRGGHGIVRETEFLDGGTLTSEADGFEHTPWGAFGGKEGDGGEAEHITADGKVTEMYAKNSGYQFGPGERYRLKTGCGGGYGDPHERPVEQVYRDFQDDLITAEIAEKQYGVVINDGELNREATAARRGGD